MHERRKILVLLLGLYIFLYMLCEACCEYSSIAFTRRVGESCNFELGLWEHGAYKERNIWSQKRMSGFVKRLLLTSWTEREFRKRTRVKYNTFKFLCLRLDPYLRKKETRFRITIPVQEKIKKTLHRLGSANGLQNIWELYEVHKNTLSKIVSKFCRIVRKHLQHVCHAPLHEECPKHHGHKGDPRVIPETYGAVGERAQVILVWVRATGIGNASHPWRLEGTRVRP